MTKGQPTRFIVLAHPRSGSQLLVNALGQHPDVRCYGELFHPRPEVRALHHRLDDGRSWREGDDAGEFLASVFAAPRPAVGFKLFYNHCEAALEALSRDSRLRVIHLHRENLLAAYVSLQIAIATDRWQVRAGEQASEAHPPLSLDAALCREFFVRVEAQRARALERFAAHPRFEVEYHALTAQFDESLARAFEHLGVAPVAVEKRLLRQASRPLREQIANFDTLAAAFAGTPWARWFALS